MSDKSKKIVISLGTLVFILAVLIILILTGVIFKKECSKYPDTKQNNEIAKQKSTIDKSQIVKYYKNIIDDNNDEHHMYSIIDINNDDIPELFLYVGGVIGKSIIASTSIYTYDENKGNADNNYIVSIGSLNDRIDNDAIYYKMNDGSLLLVIGKQGYETVASYKLENDWLVRTTFTSRETNEYTTGDNKITFKPCTDTSLFSDYK